eukprot:TRINITY_DN825_c0_g2_i1.p1 TRINITY_DN825_c0_g2~~TRINITY_DN825_c0_g2_i1.p1  ORF type:complete len:750 (-),score=267.75 TRINITY_DN825_c0_g2_i1:151-2400(-)
MGSAGDDNKKVLETFKEFDKDGNGSITKEELSSVLICLDPGYWDEDNIDALLAHVDTNRDGVIGFEEFCAWVLGADAAKASKKSPRKRSPSPGKKSSPRRSRSKSPEPAKKREPSPQPEAKASPAAKASASAVVGREGQKAAPKGAAKAASKAAAAKPAAKPATRSKAKAKVDASRVPVAPPEEEDDELDEEGDDDDEDEEDGETISALSKTQKQARDGCWTSALNMTRSITALAGSVKSADGGAEDATDLAASKLASSTKSSSTRPPVTMGVKAKKPAEEEEEEEEEDDDEEEEDGGEEEDDEEDEDEDDDDEEESEDPYDEDDLAQQKLTGVRARNLIVSKFLSVRAGSATDGLSKLKKLPLPKGTTDDDRLHAEKYMLTFSTERDADAPPGADRTAALRWLKCALVEVSEGDKRFFMPAKRLIGTTRLWPNMEDDYEEGFADLQDFAVKQLDEIGKKFETEVFEARKLGDSLGKIGKEVKPCKPRQDTFGLPLPKKFGGDDKDVAYAAFLLTAVHAIDPLYQATARKICEGVGGKCTSPAPKGFMRMLAKMETDHADADEPKTAENIDTNRVAWTIDGEEELKKAFQDAKALGKVLRVKNGYRHEFNALEISRGYRNVLANYQFQPKGLTWGQLAEDPKTQETWKKLRDSSLAMFLDLGYADEASIGCGDDDEDDAEGKRFKHFLVSLDQARELFSKAPLKDEQVSLVCEVQYMLKPYMDMRKFTHAWYKVVRADNAASLVTDYAA